MQLWEAITLGVVQGVTEFLPISSTAHLLVCRTLMGHENPKDAFTTAIQLGTLVAVVIYFWKDIVGMSDGLLKDVKARKLGTTQEGRLVWLVVLATIPAVVFGFLFVKKLKLHFYNIPAIAVVSIVFALLLTFAEWWSKRRKLPPRGESDIGWKDALFIGLFQAMALMPGASRSGTTVTAGLLAGFARPVAARFSFLLSLPVILGAGIKDLYEDWHELNANGEMVNLLVGMTVAGLIGYASIGFLLWLMKRFTTMGFVAYRIVFGVLLLIYFY